MRRIAVLALSITACAAEPAWGDPACGRGEPLEPLPPGLAVEGPPESVLGEPLWPIRDEESWERYPEIAELLDRDALPPLSAAELPLVSRALFARSERLPLLVSAWDPCRGRVVHAGHFGVVDEDGAGVSPTLPARGGFDALERATDPAFVRFVRALLVLFDGASVAEGHNTYAIVPDAIAPGDVWLERWERDGPGRAAQVSAVGRTAGHVTVELLAGWDRDHPAERIAAADAARYLTLPTGGGPGLSADGTPYAALGGGIRRFLVPVLVGGRWRNVVPARDAAVRVDDADLDGLASRPARFGALLGAR